MAESPQRQPEFDSGPERSSSHHALTPAAADLLRRNVRSHEPDSDTSGTPSDAPAPEPAQREEPLSPYMINPKYLADTSQPAGQRFHDAIAMPMAADRIRRPRMISVQDDSDVQERRMRTDAGQADRAQSQKPAAATSNRPKSFLATLGLGGLVAGIAAWWARARWAAVSGFGHVRDASAAGWSRAGGAAGAAWGRIHDRTRKIDYSSRTGARRRGIAGVAPKLPIVLPLMAILAVLAVGALTGTFENFSAGNGSQANNGDTQVGGRGAGEDANQPGAGTGSNGATTEDAAPGSTAGGSAAGVNQPGTTTGTPAGPSSQATAGTATPTPTAPDGTPLPVGGRGAGDPAIDPATGHFIDPTTGLPIDPNAGKPTN